MGILFPVGDKQGYLNLKGYYEFAAERRASGYNIFLSFAISPPTQAPPPTRSPLIQK